MTDSNSPNPADSLPPVVSPQEWARAHQALLGKEKDLTHAMDALAAERRRMPMTRVEQNYVFQTPTAKVSLLELFDGAVGRLAPGLAANTALPVVAAAR